jgi:hypothetical protein
MLNPMQMLFPMPTQDRPLPPRVRVAMTMIQQWLAETNPEPVVTDSLMHHIDGRSLDVEEAQCYLASVKCLTAFITGELKEEPQATGRIIFCPNCGGGQRQGPCDLCDGRHRIMVYPT